MTNGDIELDEFGDLRVGPDGDFCAVYGADALAQDWRNRLLSPRGSLAEDASWGFDLRQFLNAEDLPSLRSTIAAEASAELARDDRALEAPGVDIQLIESGRLRALIRGAVDFELEV